MTTDLPGENHKGAEATAEQAVGAVREFTLGELVRGDFNRLVNDLVILSERQLIAQPGYRGIVWKRPLPLHLKMRITLQRTFLAVFFYRLSHAAVKNRIPLVPRILVQMNVSRHGLEIDPNAVIGPGFRIAHTVGNVVGPVRAGKNLTLMGGVTIGGRAALDPREDGSPSIGDNVHFMGGGAAWGPIEIGSDTLIGSRAVLTQSVPPGTLVVAPKSTVIVNPPPGSNPYKV
jgi:serine O-acetyltransferase